MESTFTLLRVRGIAIGAHWSWLFVFALVVWSLATVVFPAEYHGLDGSIPVVMALVAAVVLFGSVILHELGHALRALEEGMPIKGITLWLFGGVAHLAGPPPSAGAEFRVAACGPVVSAGLAAGFGALGWLAAAAGGPAPVRVTLEYLAWINLVLLGFNLVPALPLDGGRVLRAWLWQRQQSFTAATRSAARAGKAFGYMLVAIGVTGVFTGTGGSGIWFVVVGWFLIQAAQGEATQALVRHALGDLRVRDVMDGDPVPGDAGASAEGPVVGADQPVTEALVTLQRSKGRAVVVEDDRPVGVLRIADVAEAVERGRGRDAGEPPARSAGAGVWVVVALVILGAGAALYHPPYVVVSPGEAIEVSDDIRIEGVPVDRLDGRYFITTVRLTRPSALRTLWASLRADREVLPASQLVPPGVSQEEYGRIQRTVFRESRDIAAAAAARAVGLAVSVTGSGARVVDVVDGSPAEGRLAPGDVVVQVDGRAIGTSEGLRGAIRSQPAGTALRVVVERDGGREEVTVESRDLPDLAGGVGIGVLIETRDFAVDLPFEISFEERDIGGPSAGLAYALAIADLLEEGDFARGRAVAATGTVDITGDVGPVGGVEQKAIAVDAAGADVFLVPAAEVDEAERRGLRVIGVDSVGDALAGLRNAA